MTTAGRGFWLRSRALSPRMRRWRPVDASAPSIADAPLQMRPAASPRRWARRGSSACSRPSATQLPLWLPVGLVLGIAAWFWLPDRPRLDRLHRSRAGRSRSACSRCAPGTRWGRALAIFAARRDARLRPDSGGGRSASRRRGLSASGWWSSPPRSRRFSRSPPSRSVALARPADRRAGLPPRLRVNVDEDRIVPRLAPGRDRAAHGLADAAGADGGPGRL